MKLKFTIDPKYDAKYARVFLSMPDYKSRAKHMGLNDDLVERLYSSDGENLTQAKQEFESIVEDTYSSLMPYIERSRIRYQESWDEIFDEFSNLLVVKTKPWYYPEYIVVVTHFCRGVRDPEGGKIGRWWRDNADIQRRLTAYELIEAHFVDICRNEYTGEDLSKKQIWALSEIAANAFTGLDEDMKKFWPWDNAGYYTNHNYPQIVELQKELEGPFLERNSFDDYFQKGIELVRKYQI